MKMSNYQSYTIIAEQLTHSYFYLANAISRMQYRLVTTILLWWSRAEYVCRVVYYWVQCVIVRVTCGARSLHSAASTCAYKEREHHDK